MGMYHDGYHEAVKNVMQCQDKQELLEWMDGLLGRGEFDENDHLEDIKSELLEQVRKDFTDTSSPEYEQTEFWGKIMQSGGLP